MNQKEVTSAAKLEQVLSQALRGLALRPAPQTLESRVCGELQRRAALPWWRSGFSHWPVMARAAFVVLGVSLVGALLLGGFSIFGDTRSFDVIAGLLISWAQPALAIMSTAGGLAALMLRVIPPFWLYGGLTLGALLYVALFGLGAAAYRTLYLQPSQAGE